MPVVSLFDRSGNMVRDWALDGHECYCFDIEQNEHTEQYNRGGSITYIKMDLSNDYELLYIICKLSPYILFGFPPCTDLAVSGAKHFARKFVDNVMYEDEAIALARTVELIGDCCACPWFAENPVSRLNTLWRSPDHIYNPNDFGGYLGVNDVHPNWPEYIPPRDAYIKKTCGWTGNGFIWPVEAPIPAMVSSVSEDIRGSLTFLKLGGSSDKTKTIRSETPRGFARACWWANRSAVKG